MNTGFNVTKYNLQKQLREESSSQMSSPLLSPLEARALPVEFQMDGYRRGIADLRSFSCRVVDGVLRIVVSRDPVGDAGQLLTHASCTVGDNGYVGTPPRRRASIEEAAAAWMLLFPQLKWEEYGTSALCTHLWEVAGAK